MGKSHSPSFLAGPTHFTPTQLEPCSLSRPSPEVSSLRVSPSFPFLVEYVGRYDIVLKEKLHKAERAQLNFAGAASHELRTPLHQLNAAASLLRHSLHAAMEQL